MITEDRLHHSIGVARKAYDIAKRMKLPEALARNMFALGWNHDIGYEFCPEDHAACGEKMLPGYRYAFEIKKHGFPPDEQYGGLSWVILNLADMTTSPTGDPVTIDERLEEICNRYGKDHEYYLLAKGVCERLRPFWMKWEREHEHFGNWWRLGGWKALTVDDTNCK